MKCPKCKETFDPKHVSLSRRKSKTKLPCGHTISYGLHPVLMNKVKAEQINRG